MAIVAALATDRCAHLQSSQAGTDIAGEAAYVADVVSLLPQGGPDLGWVQVGAEPAHHDNLDTAAGGP